MSGYAGKTTLSHEEHLKLLGLGVLISNAYRQVNVLEAAMHHLLGCDGYDDGGFIISDELYGNGSMNVDEILKRHDITVLEEVTV